MDWLFDVKGSVSSGSEGREGIEREREREGERKRERGREGYNVANEV